MIPFIKVQMFYNGIERCQNGRIECRKLYNSPQNFHPPSKLNLQYQASDFMRLLYEKFGWKLNENWISPEKKKTQVRNGNA